jgi:DNA polymerase V
MRAIYKEGFQLIKAGVMLLDLQSDSVQQRELGLEGDNEPERIQLMSTLHTLNQRFGQGTVAIASAGGSGKSSNAVKDQRVWAMKQQRRTPQYTTNWADVPMAKA